MQVQLLKNTTNTKSFNRNFLSQANFDVVLKNPTDVLSPEFVLNTSSPIDYNMMYIPDFKRYYFIGVENLNYNVWRVYAKNIDTLFTYKQQLLNLNAIIDKQEKNNNPLIDDGSFIRQVNTYPEVVKFSGGFSDSPTYIMITANG